MAELVFNRAIQGTQVFASGEKEHVIDLVATHGSAVDASRTILLIDVYSDSAARHNCHHRAHLSPDGTTLTIARAGASTTPSAESEVAYKLIEFSSGLTVRRVSGGGSGSVNSDTPLGYTIDPLRTFGIFTYALNLTGSSTESSSIGLFFPDAENFRVDGSSTIAQYLSFELQVVEFDADAGAGVEYVGTQATGGSTTEVPLLLAADPLHTSIFGTVCRGPSEGSSSNRSVAADLVDGGITLRLRKGGSSTVTWFHIFVVRWPEWVFVLTSEIPTLTFGVGNYDAPIPEVESWEDSVPYQQGGSPYFGSVGQSSNPVAQWWMTQPGADTASVACRRDTGFEHFGPSIVQVLAFGGVGDPTPTWPDDLRQGLMSMPENHWRCPVLTPGKTNNWSATRTPSDRRASSGASADVSIFYAWPASAIDTQREQIVHFGGGHGNYSGNEVYAVSIHTGLWERLNLPSRTQAVGDHVITVGGPDDAPPGAHCYSSTVYLEKADMLFIHGGAVVGLGGRFYRNAEGDPAGPYLRDLSKRDPWKVGGSTGTGYVLEDEGLNGWINAYSPDYTTDGGTDATFFGQQVTSYSRVENDKDVIYQFGGLGSSLWLRKTVVNDVNDWSQQTAEVLGGESGFTVLGKAAWIQSTNLFVAWRNSDSMDPVGALRLLDVDGKAHGKTTFYTVDLADPDGAIAQLSRPLRFFSLVWDSKRDRIVGFSGLQLIEIRHPGVTPDGTNEADVTSGWSIHLIDAGRDTDYRPLREVALRDAAPYGKWHYYAPMDCFFYTEAWAANNQSIQSSPFLWIYKPENWEPPPLPDTLVIDFSTHAHTATHVELAAGAVTLEPADAYHAHSATHVVLEAGAVTLEPADAHHAHTADHVQLTAPGQLVVADALHAHSADHVVLTPPGELVAADAMHAHTADHVQLTLPMYHETPAARIGRSPVEVRQGLAPSEIRATMAAAETRRQSSQ